MENIDHIYYINLDHRDDRDEEIQGELFKLQIDPQRVTRVSGIYTNGFGILGCGLTHKFIVEQFLLSPYRNCLILEDDFQFLFNSKIIQESIGKIFQNNINFDVIMLSGNILLSETTPYSFLRKVLDGQTTSGYILSKKFAPKLLQSFTESTKLLQNFYRETRKKKYEYCLDIYWKKLQPYSNWFVLSPKLGIQRKSFSDIENKITNYQV
jgi:GR25 family glycosyltransferase involved in LPS biosynthesis